MAHGTVERQGRTPPAPERVGGAGWTAVWLTGAVALSAEGVFALVVFFLVGLRDEHYIAGGFGAYIGYLLGAVIAMVVLGLAGLAGSAAVVLPVVQLSRWSARRKERTETVRWCLAVCGAVAAAAALCIGVPTALLGGSWTALPLVLLVAFLGLVPAVLCSRTVTVLRGNPARFGLAAAVLGCGLALSAVVFVGGVAAYGTGLLQEYEPPRLTDAQLVGTWSDDRGGTLTLRADGTAVADELGVHGAETADGADVSGHCSGSGSWAKGTSPSGTPQLDLDVSDCTEPNGWDFGGTEEQPTLFHWIGDPDSLNRHVLHRGASAQ
ncbi:hypothetical protein SAMN05421870_12117 [Streptomyces qinglanensis]|uniref:Uncharacterized protein n=1 Tax=Streptomyces qinglanensis TaxID=943816 RepID=A0A1H9WUX2_9ACTN|nr:hypothetical protein SAMN05421870_12117 [Streptomyces qinglanensis]